MTTSEGGYCSGNTIVKEQMLADLHEGIDAATKLGLYVIVDWHMVGATDPADKNPLTLSVTVEAVAVPLKKIVGVDCDATSICTIEEES